LQYSQATLEYLEYLKNTTSNTEYLLNTIHICQKALQDLQNDVPLEEVRKFWNANIQDACNDEGSTI